jgi:hypothetical protein
MTARAGIAVLLALLALPAAAVAATLRGRRQVGPKTGVLAADGS